MESKFNMYNKKTHSNADKYNDKMYNDDILIRIISFFFLHDRSAHGFSDTDMSNLLEQLQRESDDLCGHRGLTPGSKFD